MSPIPRGDDLTHAGRIKKLEEKVAQLARRDTVIADPAGVPRDMILLNDVTVPTVQAAITDGLPPASSPAAEVIGGIGSLFIRWTPVANANPVTYRVYVDTTTGFTEGPGNLVGSTGGSSITVRTLTAGTALAYGTTYYAKIVASDADGSALAGAEGSGSMLQVNAPDIAANAITATKLSADAIDGKVITGTTLRTAVTGVRTEISGPGLPRGIAFYTGDALEFTPGSVGPITVTDELQLKLESPSVNGASSTAVILASGKGTTRNRFSVGSQDINLDGAVTIGVSRVPAATTTGTQTLTNKDLTSATNTFPTFPYAYAHLNADTAAMTASTWTTISPWMIDTGSGVTVSTGTFTVPLAGRYRVTLGVSHAANATGSRGCRIIFAGAGTQNMIVPTNPAAGIQGAVFVAQSSPLAANATITAEAWHNSTVSLAVRGDTTGDFTSIQIEYIGP